MNWRFTGSPLLMAAMVFIAACDSAQTSSSGPAAQAEYLRFEYQVAALDQVDIHGLNNQLQNGELVVEEADLGIGDQAWCRYDGVFEPMPSQVDADMIPEEQTRAPVLNAFGNPRSMGFNFLVAARQARNRAQPCGDLDQTIQGLDFVSSQGSASGSWRPGDEALAVTRPEMGNDWLGKALEYRNELNGDRLFFDHAVDRVSPFGYVEGRFCFLAVSESGDKVVLIRNGEFGMNNQR